MENLLKPSEVASKLGISKKKVYDMSKKNELPVIKIGSSLRFRESDLEQWLSEQKSK